MSRSPERAWSEKAFRRQRQGKVILCLIVGVVALIARLATWPLPDSGARPSQTAIVLRVVDGDTLLISKDVRVRLLGVNTPESVKPNTPVEPFSKEASDFTRRHVEGKLVRLEFDRERHDEHGRILAYVYQGNWFLNEELIKAGLSPAVTRFPYSEAMKQRFRAAEQSARRRKVGLWSGDSR